MQANTGSLPRVAIAGGGFGGLACAKLLADAGFPVTLIERAPYLGGRASTFRDEDGDWIEQGLHLFHGAYTELRQLLRDIGQPPCESVFFTDYIRFEEPGGPRATFGTHPLYEPLLTLRSVLGNNDYLGPRAKAAILPLLAPALLPMARLQQRFDECTVREWWRSSSGNEDVLERVLRPFCRAIQFTDVEQFSAYNFLGWIHHTLTHPLRARLGCFRGPSEEVVFRPFADYLRQRGVEIRMTVELHEILYDAESRRITGFGLAGGERLDADVYVVALPQWIFVDKLPAALRDEPFFARIAQLPVAPAISVQLWFDRSVTDIDGFIMVPRSHTPTYQDQARIMYPYAGGSRISVIVTPADQMLDWDDAAIVQYVHSTLARANPKIAQAEIVKRVVLKHPRHLIRPLPGAMSQRPRQYTPIANLFLAGDWTQQDFFGSQEGAVRGGQACARAIMRAAGRG